MKEKVDECKECNCAKHWSGKGVSGGVYCLGFIGAIVYYLQYADTFWIGVLGVLKAIVWPAMLVYEALKFLGM